MTSTTPVPPKAKEIPYTHSEHEAPRKDSYHWLKDRDNPKVIDHLKAENTYFDQIMTDSEPLIKELQAEYKSRMLEDDESVPYIYKNFLYEAKVQKNQQHHQYWRSSINDSSKRELLLDLNTWAKKNENVSLGNLVVSPDESKVAFSIDAKGTETYALYVYDIASGKEIDSNIKQMTGSFEWSADSGAIFYTTHDHMHRPDKAFIHKLCEDNSQDILLLHESNEAFYMNLHKTSDEKFIIISFGDMESNESYYLNALSSDSPTVSLFLKMKSNQLYSLDHFNHNWFITHNKNALNFMVSKTQTDKIDMSQWNVFIPHHDEALFESLLFFDNKSFFIRRENAQEVLYSQDLNSSVPVELNLDLTSPGFLSFGSNADPHLDFLRITHQSPISPPATYDYYFKTKELKLIKKKNIPNFNSDNYICKRIFVTSRDKEQIPVTLVASKNRDLKNINAACHVYAYGSYGSTYTPYFSSSSLSLCDRNFLFVIAHVRGSQAKGRYWYLNGKLKHKQNTFSDFIDVTKHLIDDGYCHPKKVSAEGASAGGLLMGVITNQAPELYQSIIAGVPFVDVLTTLFDPNLRFSLLEYTEWGNPLNKEYFDIIRAYSPYDNISDTIYPHVLALAGFHDTRVNFWEPAKWVQKLRDFNKGTSKQLVLTDFDSGHSGSTGRYDRLLERAQIHGFVINNLKISKS